MNTSNTNTWNNFYIFCLNLKKGTLYLFQKEKFLTKIETEIDMNVLEILWNYFYLRHE